MGSPTAEARDMGGPRPGMWGALDRPLRCPPRCTGRALHCKGSSRALNQPLRQAMVARDKDVTSGLWPHRALAIAAPGKRPTGEDLRLSFCLSLSP